MILIFHSIYFLLKHLWKTYNRSRAIEKFRKCHSLQGSKVNGDCLFDAESKLHFDPPVFKQRYVAVQEALLRERLSLHIAKVVDFGCAELRFFQYLKRLYGINEILCVDIMENLLKDNLYRTHPLTIDYLKRRTEPLKVNILCGSISDPDYRLSNVDAVIGIEIIEHLYPDILEALPYNIFHFIQPIIAIFTTPNADFNVLFSSSLKFRHNDHKFEWTREQFESWALNITVRFPHYKVFFEGIGQGPVGTESLGCCSQMAVFVRKEIEEQLSEVPRSCREITSLKNLETYKNEEILESQGICTYFSYSSQMKSLDSNSSIDRDLRNNYYKEIEMVEYPFEVDNRTLEEKVLAEIKYKVYSFTSYTSRFYNDETDRVEVPLYELVSNEEGCFTSTIEIRNLLRKENFQIEECIIPGCDQKVLCVIHDFNMDNRSSSPNSNNSDEKNNLNIPWHVSSEETNWDAEYSQSTSVKINPSDSETCPALRTGEDQQNVTADLSNLHQSEQKIMYQYHSSLESPSCKSEQKPEQKPKEDTPLRKKRSVQKVRSFSNEKNESKSKHIGSFHKKQTGSNDNGSAVNYGATSQVVDKYVPKKGVNTKNRDQSQGTSKELPKKPSDLKPPDSSVSSSKESGMYREVLNKQKKNSDIKQRDSVMQGTSFAKGTSRLSKTSVSGNTKTVCKGKLSNSTPTKKIYGKFDDPLPGTSDLRKKKKGKRTDADEIKEDIKNLTECILYNSLNRINEIDEAKEEHDEELKELIIEEQPVVENGDLANNNRDLEGNNYPNEPLHVDGQEDEVIRNQDFQNKNQEEADDGVENNDAKAINIPLGQELSHASREALFDPNSEVDMLEEFEIPSLPSTPPVNNIVALQQPNVLLIGLNGHLNNEENVVLPENADPFPNWLLQLLGATVEDGESHDEPHFYCQGDGIGVHPSIIEVEIDEEETSSDSSSSNDTAVAERTISEPGLASLPNDEIGERDDGLLQDEAMAVIGRVISPEFIPSMPVTLPAVTPPGGSSAAESADEFFDSIEETSGVSDTARTNPHSLNKHE